MTRKRTHPHELSQKELLDAVQMYLVWRGDITRDTVGMFKHRFGIVGEPVITLVGDACDTPNAGHVYLEWDFEPLPNVVAPRFGDGR